LTSSSAEPGLPLGLGRLRPPTGKKRREVRLLEGLGEIIVEPGLKIAGAVLGKGIGGQRHDGRTPRRRACILGVKRPDAGRRLHPVHVRHVDVHEHEVEAFALGLAVS